MGCLSWVIQTKNDRYRPRLTCVPNLFFMKCCNTSIPWHHSRRDSWSPPFVHWERLPTRGCPSPTRTVGSLSLVCRDGRVLWAIPGGSHWHAHPAIPLGVHPRISGQNQGGYPLVICEDGPMSGSSQRCSSGCTGSSHVTKYSWVHLGHKADKGSFPPSWFLWLISRCCIAASSLPLAHFRSQMLKHILCWDLPVVPWVSAGIRSSQPSSGNHFFRSAEYRLETIASWLTCWCISLKSLAEHLLMLSENEELDMNINLRKMIESLKFVCESAHPIEMFEII